MRAGQLPIDEQVTQFRAALARNGTLTEVLARAAAMGLPGWYLVAGCLYQTVWNVVTGQPPEAGILDYDLAYFDDTDLSWDAEDAVIQAGHEVFAGLPAPVQIRNQARVHLWYEPKFGIPLPAARLDRGGDRHLRGHHRLPRRPPAPRWPVADLRPARPRRRVQPRRRPNRCSRPESTTPRPRGASMVTRQSLPRAPIAWAHLTVVSVLLCVAPFLLFAWAEQHIDSGLASIYNATTPLMTDAGGPRCLAASVLPGHGWRPAHRVHRRAGRAGSVGRCRRKRPDRAGRMPAGHRQLWRWRSSICVASYHRSGWTPSAATVQVGLARVVMLVLAPVLATGPVHLSAAVVISVLALGAAASPDWPTVLEQQRRALPGARPTPRRSPT